MDKKEIPDTSDVFDAYARGACGLRFIHYRMAEMEKKLRAIRSIVTSDHESKDALIDRVRRILE